MVKGMKLQEFILAEKKSVRLDSTDTQCLNYYRHFGRVGRDSHDTDEGRVAKKIDLVDLQSQIRPPAHKFSVKRKAKLCISFQSFNENNNTAKTVINSIKLSKLGTAYPKSIRLPTKRTLYTVLRSPHVDKKSREQFEMKIHKQTFIVETENQYIRNQLLRLLFQDTPGIQCQVVVNYTTSIQLAHF